MLTAKLIVADNGCFSVTTAGAAPTLLVFPSNSALSASTKPAVEVEGQNYTVGSLFTFTGDWVTLSDAELLEVVPCDPEGDVFIVSYIDK